MKSGSINITKEAAGAGIAALCLGYFASYVPYSMMTKMLTDGLFGGMDGVGFTGFEMQPVAVIGSFVTMYLFITFKGWWKYCTHSKIFGISVPRPQWFTLLSGFCTASQIITTTLAYTFHGISIVFAMLLMRGGVLVIAPVIDVIVKKRKRKIYWPSWVASGLSLSALFVAFSSKSGATMTVAASINIAAYLFGYFFRLLIMSNKAKSDDEAERKRYFTEEQMVATPLLLIAIFLIGFLGRGGGAESIGAQFWSGFTLFPFKGFLLITLLIGVFSSGNGLFGSLIFLDKRENTFTVPCNRASSILAGIVATYALALFYGQKYPGTDQLIGAALIIGAILFLMYRALIESGKKKRAARALGKKV